MTHVNLRPNIYMSDSNLFDVEIWYTLDLWDNGRVLIYFGLLSSPGKLFLNIPLSEIFTSYLPAQWLASKKIPCSVLVIIWDNPYDWMILHAFKPDAIQSAIILEVILLNPIHSMIHAWNLCPKEDMSELFQLKLWVVVGPKLYL